MESAVETGCPPCGCPPSTPASACVLVYRRKCVLRRGLVGGWWWRRALWRLTVLGCLAQVSALEVLDEGDDELVYRAMHCKLMSAHHKSASNPEKQARGGAGGHDEQQQVPQAPAGHGEWQDNAIKNAGEDGGWATNEAVQDAASKEHMLHTPGASLGSERAAEKRDDAPRAGGSPGGRDVGQQLRKSTTSAMAIRFEALKQTYAQVRSRSSCLARGDGSGRQELMRRALEVARPPHA